MTDRLVIYEKVLTCTNCDRCLGGNGPVPFNGPTPARLAVLGEGPGKADDENGQLFQGEAGEMLRGIIKGVFGDMFLDPAKDVFFCNAVSCWSETSPTKDEVAACQPNVLDQLRLAAPAWLLVLGQTALNSFHPKLPIGKMRGRFFLPKVLPGATAYVTYHPAAAVRKSAYESEIIRDLRKLKGVMMHDGRWNWESDLVDASCVVCDEELVVWYSDGIPLCIKHAPQAFDFARVLARKHNADLARDGTVVSL